MAKQPKKRRGARPDFSETAFRVMQEATGQAPKTQPPDAGKDPAAIKRGRLGGIKGGKARADSLTKKRRTAIAKKAAAARWSNQAGK
jgi:hypothetical protein